MIWLLNQSGERSTVTIWGQDDLEFSDVKNLCDLIETVGKNKFYLDTRSDIRNAILTNLIKQV